MMPVLPVSSIPQWKWNHCEAACLELFEAIGCFKLTFIEAHEASKMICNVRSLTSRIKKRSHLEEIITSTDEVFNDFPSDMAVEIKKRIIPTRESAENNSSVTQNGGS